MLDFCKLKYISLCAVCSESCFITFVFVSWCVGKAVDT